MAIRRSWSTASKSNLAAAPFRIFRSVSGIQPAYLAVHSIVPVTFLADLRGGPALPRFGPRDWARFRVPSPRHTYCAGRAINVSKFYWTRPREEPGKAT